jgi:hypothetical protein
MMPDPDFYRQCLQDSFDELLAAANSTVKATAAKSKRATSTKPKRAA